jgi:type VI secretion system secreted protein VgrG
MPTWTRTNALMTMTSALGADVLIPISLSAHEAISTPFQFNVEAVCQQGTVDPNTLLNQPACVTLQGNGAPIRYFHGIVQSVSAGSPIRGQTGADTYTIYNIVLVPKLWFMGQTVDCRVYETKSAADILNGMFADIGLTDLSGPPSATSRQYTVQFNESDLHFATRLMEEEGWFYFFRHTASAHTLVIASDNSAFTAIPNATLGIGGSTTEASPRIAEFHKNSGTVFGKWSLRDYDPENPATQLTSDQPTTLATGGASTRDAFRWPALTFDNGTVVNRATWEMQAAEASATLFEGTSHFGGMVPGGTFVIASRPAGSYDETYAVRGTSHHARDETWLSQSAVASYSAHFTCFLKSVTWRQPAVTRRPRLDGIHTALVMGPQSSAAADIQMQSGEEIYTDKLGRVKVRFYWDHRGDATGSDAVWARVIQPWAGNGWGAQFIPRVGTEVAVGFVDGDPDRPMVMGGLYNGVAAPIYSDSDKTKLGFRTRSTLSGSTSQFSEFTIDDNSGSELIYFHAEKDYTTEVEHDQTLTVDNCRVVTVTKDETVTIKGKQSITVTGNRTIEVKQGNLSETVDQGNYALDVSLGSVSIKADAGAITMEAMTSITIKVGSNSMTIDQSGIKLDGMMVKITGQTMTQMASPMTTVKGDGMLTLKGGVVMIN